MSALHRNVPVLDETETARRDTKIRTLCRDGLTQQVVALRFGISQKLVSQIINHKRPT